MEEYQGLAVSVNTTETMVNCSKLSVDEEEKKTRKNFGAFKPSYARNVVFLVEKPIFFADKETQHLRVYWQFLKYALFFYHSRCNWKCNFSLPFSNRKIPYK